MNSKSHSEIQFLAHHTKTRRIWILSRRILVKTTSTESEKNVLLGVKCLHFMNFKLTYVLDPMLSVVDSNRLLLLWVSGWKAILPKQQQQQQQNLSSSNDNHFQDIHQRSECVESQSWALPLQPIMMTISKVGANKLKRSFLYPINWIEC